MNIDQLLHEKENLNKKIDELNSQLDDIKIQLNNHYIDKLKSIIPTLTYEITTVLFLSNAPKIHSEFNYEEIPTGKYYIDEIEIDIENEHIWITPPYYKNIEYTVNYLGITKLKRYDSDNNINSAKIKADIRIRDIKFISELEKVIHCYIRDTDEKETI